MGIKLVECYQHYTSEEVRRRCLCVPSCSEYAIACFKKYWFIQAILKIRKRLYFTCQGDEYKLDPP
ncbi:MAG: membrane protein insertion efficiency factor YidD [Clostridia bacterium]|nr:membrane protein insertion efficiency factor YidD [Clostridia bacterium]